MPTSQLVASFPIQLGQRFADVTSANLARCNHNVVQHCACLKAFYNGGEISFECIGGSGAASVASHMACMCHRYNSHSPSPCRTITPYGNNSASKAGVVTGAVVAA